MAEIAFVFNIGCSAEAIMSVPAPPAAAAAAAAAPVPAAAQVPFVGGQSEAVTQAVAFVPAVLTPEQEAKLEEELEVKLGLLWASADN